MHKITLSTHEFFKKFPDEETARRHLEQRRWNGAPACPACGSADNQHKQKRDGKQGYFRCYHCNTVYTVRTGTVLHRSHVPLHKWMYAIYLVTTGRASIAAVRLSKELGVEQSTVCSMLQRISQACRKEKMTIRMAAF